MNYKTSDGDVLDYICWQHYSKQSGAVEIVLKANPHIADRGSILPAGIDIILPDIPKATIKPTIRLWA